MGTDAASWAAELAKLRARLGEVEGERDEARDFLAASQKDYEDAHGDSEAHRLKMLELAAENAELQKQMRQLAIVDAWQSHQDASAPPLSEPLAAEQGEEVHDTTDEVGAQGEAQGASSVRRYPTVIGRCSTVRHTLTRPSLDEPCTFDEGHSSPHSFYLPPGFPPGLSLLHFGPSLDGLGEILSVEPTSDGARFTPADPPTANLVDASRGLVDPPWLEKAIEAAWVEYIDYKTIGGITGLNRVRLMIRAALPLIAAGVLEEAARDAPGQLGSVLFTPKQFGCWLGERAARQVTP